MLQPLPRAWVDRIFSRLQGVYGREFAGQYSTGLIDGIDHGMENAKQVWAEELAGFTENPDAIAYALETLPDRAPNAIKFRDACRRAPEKPKVLIENKLTQAQMSANKQRVADMIASLKMVKDANDGQRRL